MMGRETVYVLDSSVLIDTKRVIAPRHQWDFFERLKVLVQERRVCFPRAVRNELGSARHVDTPEAWALSAFEHVPRSFEPGLDTVGHVMDVAGDVVEADAEGEPADPYVLAQALELERSGVADAVVVTKDREDRWNKIAMTTACGRLGLTHCSLEEFLREIAFDPRAGWT